MHYFIKKNNIGLFDPQMKILYMGLIESAVNWYSRWCLAARLPRVGRLQRAGVWRLG